MINKLATVNGVSGNEDAVREIILNEAEQYSDDITQDDIGNIICHKKRDNAPSIMLYAHMDEVGFIVSNVTPEGWIKFQPIGKVNSSVLLSKQVVIGSNMVRGVIAVRPKHLAKDDDGKNTSISELFIDIGASNRQQALNHVALGDYIAFSSDYIEFGEEGIKAKALDSRVSCAVILDLMRDNYIYDMYYIFTSQEKIGYRGTQALDLATRPSLAIKIDGAECSDFPKSPDEKSIMKVGGGASISILDGNCVHDIEQVKNLYTYAIKHEINAQYKDISPAKNSNNFLNLKCGGIKTVSVNFPYRYMDSPSNVASKSDIKSVKDLIGGYLKDEQI
ncbi:MAG: M42 family peptidase [Clostridiales bacterium]|jgi:endoglucanase|nr:M42 family peptidase [Clostridiales bacterium]